MTAITCGNCHTTHTSVAAVKACHTGDLFTCHWLVEFPGQWVVVDDTTGETDFIDGGTRDCGAEAIATERGWTCAAGHEHVTAQARHDERWDYAETYGEARNMALAGVEPLTMDGHLVLGPGSFAPPAALAGAR